MKHYFKGAYLKDLVDKSGYSYPQIHSYLDCSESAFYSYLRGSTPSTDVVLRMADMFDVTVESLFIKE